MRIYVSQVYVQPGVRFPFSALFQKRIGEELTSRVTVTDRYLNSEFRDFSFIFNMSAKAELQKPEIKGPDKNKRDKRIEYSVFLPHSSELAGTSLGRQASLEALIESIAATVQAYGIDVSKLRADTSSIAEIIAADASLLRQAN